MTGGYLALQEVEMLVRQPVRRIPSVQLKKAASRLATPRNILNQFLLHACTDQT